MRKDKVEFNPELIDIDGMDEKVADAIHKLAMGITVNTLSTVKSLEQLRGDITNLYWNGIIDQLVNTALLGVLLGIDFDAMVKLRKFVDGELNSVAKDYNRRLSDEEMMQITNKLLEKIKSKLDELRSRT
jgi:hypothetical protein